MSIVTFLNGGNLTLASNRLVYTPEETGQLRSMIDNATALTELLQCENDRIKAAEAAGHEIGYEKGQSEGYEAALGHIAIKLMSLAKEADETREKLEGQTADLALKVVEKITEELGPAQTLASLAAAAARQLVPREPVNLRVSVSNLERVQNAVKSSKAFSERISEVTGDPALNNEDCVLDTEFGQIRANLDVQLNTFREHFRATEQ